MNEELAHELSRLYALRQQIEKLNQEARILAADFNSSVSRLAEEMEWDTLYLVPGLTEQGVIVETTEHNDEFCLRFRPIS